MSSEDARRSKRAQTHTPAGQEQYLCQRGGPLIVEAKYLRLGFMNRQPVTPAHPCRAPPTPSLTFVTCVTKGVAVKTG